MGNDKIQKYLAQARAYYDKLRQEHQSLVTDVEQDGWESYNVHYSDPERAHALTICMCALRAVADLLERWENANKEDKWKQIRLHNLGTRFGGYYQDLLKVSGPEVDHTKQGMEKLNRKLGILEEMPSLDTKLYYW